MKAPMRRTLVVFVTLFSLSLSLSQSLVMASNEYLYLEDKDAKPVIEQTAEHDFETSSKARLVEFYSPVSESRGKRWF